MRLIEEEDQFGQVHIAHLGQCGVKFTHEPEQEGGIQFGLQHEFVGCEHIHHALSPLTLHEVIDIERRLSEELVGPLALQLEERPLDGPDRGRGDVTILGGIVLGVLSHPVEHGAEVLQVEEEQAALIGYFEHDVEHPVLRLIELHEARQQLRSHLRDGCPHGMTLLAEDIEEPDGARLELRIIDTEFWQSFLDESTQSARLRYTGEVAFHIGHEARHPRLAECFGQHLQCNGFSRTGGPGYKSMPIGHFTFDGKRSVGAMGDVQPSFSI